ncbi:PE domain-containing protein [Actinophytocola xanthii]|uniref:PE domain-containing protein n=1 Tax=Actinophytocola xanthii TaxID=1912961 RepID=A0A1Q8CA74_9PSEU|nr:PE domain-containing protein [Actinophytocola xanthii]OLF11264.1 hypothetical protein BU204_30780 [Actinophytocola xanthii]
MMDGYTFDPESFQEVRRSWTDLLAGLENDLKAAERLMAVQAPGHEPASGFVAATQNDSGKALLGSITEMRAFALGYLRSLDHSQREYQARETSGVDTFRTEAG